MAVETSTAAGSVAVWDDGLAFEQVLRIQGTHSERLLPAIDHALTVTGVAPEAVAAFVVGAGPGSFTGVRIGAAMAKGWAMARGTQLFAYPSLLVAAAGTGALGPVCAMFDAKRGQVYAACYEWTGDDFAERLAPGAWRVEELLGELSSRDVRPVFCGAGADVYQGAIRSVYGQAQILPKHLGTPRAASLLWLRKVAPDRGRVDDPQTWEPLYVRGWRVTEERGRA